MKYIITIVLTILTNMAQAQYDTLYMAVAPFNSASSQGKAFAKTAEGMAINKINDDYRMIRVDRDQADAVRWEREFQKSEDFIDGKIVEQGKAIGAEYVLDGHYDHAAKQLRMAIYEVNSGTLKCSVAAMKPSGKKKKRTGVLDLLTLNIDWDESSSGSSYPSNSVIKNGLEELFEACFPKKSWAVLRPIDENKSKVKELLVAAGSRMNLKKGKLLEIQVLHIEEVDGVKLERLESAGWGKIVVVESDNFSRVKLEAGGKNIKNLLAQGKKLRCRPLKKK